MEMNYNLYHGSSVHGLDYLEPRHRYTPGAEHDSPEGIYASDDAAFAAGHAFPWHSEEGIDLGYYDETMTMTLQVPVSLRWRLDQSISIYTVDPKDFVVLPEVAPRGRTYRSLEKVKCLEEKCFDSVWEAFTAYGGQMRVVGPSK
jgi:hypothetical protein